MRHLAAASPAFVQQHFADGVRAGRTGASALPRVFNTKDALQATWARRLCHRHVELPRHLLPSSQVLWISVAVAGMGWGLHPHAPIAQHLEDGSLVELVPDTPLGCPPGWQHARAASALLDELSRRADCCACRAARP